LWVGMMRQGFLVVVVVLLLVLRMCLVTAPDGFLDVAILAGGCGTAHSIGILLTSLKEEEGKLSNMSMVGLTEDKDFIISILVQLMPGRDWMYSSVFIIMVALLFFSRLFDFL
jgi:hypothetical protein